MGGKQTKPVIEYQQAKRQTPPHELLLFMAMFQRLSSDRTLSGSIANDAFARNVLLPECSKYSTTAIQRLLAVIDTNGNGSVEWSEFVSVMYLFTRGSDDEKLQLIFNMFDLNADNRISKKEFTTIALDLLTINTQQQQQQQQQQPQVLEHLRQLFVNAVMMEYSRMENGSLTYAEWRRYAMEDERIMELVRCFGRIKTKHFDLETALLLQKRRKSSSLSSSSPPL